MQTETSYPKDKIKILLLEGIHQSAIDTFKAANYNNIELLPKALPEADLIEKIKDVSLVGIRSKTQMNARVIAAAKKLKAIACFCIGTNQVDLEAATEAGIAVFNSPYNNTRSVAELVIAETIILMRRVAETNMATHEGIWLKTAAGSYEVRGKKMGIIGYGHIGSQVSVLAEAMGMKVFYYDIEPKLVMGNALAVSSLDELLENSDVISLHVPATPETKNMIGEAEFKKMKKGSILLNLSRGNVVDIDALRAALESGHIAGAGIDVFPKEPKSKYDFFETPLQKLPNVILTPHIGGSTLEAQQTIGIDATQKMINYLDTGSTVGSHSVPSLTLPTHQQAHRILHIHENKTGVLRSINEVLADADVNILGQYLKTNPKIGYVVLDVDKATSPEMLSALRAVKHTINVRVLY